MTHSEQPVRVGASRPNQLLHTFGVGAVADMPNLSVITKGLDHWDFSGVPHSRVDEERLLAAVRLRLGNQVSELRLPPYVPETNGDTSNSPTSVGVPVGLFPTWLRCAHNKCNQLARADGGLFELVTNGYSPERTRFVHSCRDERTKRPPAVPARFVLACEDGHLDDFCWDYFVHRGKVRGGGHPLKLEERGTTGEAADVFVQCTGCGTPEQPFGRSMVEAFGERAEETLPLCRGRHPHLDLFEGCGKPTRTMVLGATNSWFPMRLSTITVPRDHDPLEHLVAEHWAEVGSLASLEEAQIRDLLPKMEVWARFDRYDPDKVVSAIKKHHAHNDESTESAANDLLTPEWRALTGSATTLPDFTTRDEPVPRLSERGWLDRVVLVTRLREVSALYGFTRIDAPPWDPREPGNTRRAPLVEGDRPNWVPCAESRGEGVFLQFNEERIAAWENDDPVETRIRRLTRGHDRWRAARQLDPAVMPEARYLLLHTFAHTLIREFALESGYGAAGIRERIYARDGMAGVLLYTAAPDSEGTLGGLVSLGQQDRLGLLIERALEAARRCSSDPLCAEHDPAEQGRLYGAACHACLFASETSCERGNHYLDRALLVQTVAGSPSSFFG